MAGYVFYMTIAVTITAVNLDLLTDLDHFDDIIADNNSTQNETESPEEIQRHPHSINYLHRYSNPANPFSFSKDSDPICVHYNQTCELGACEWCSTHHNQLIEAAWSIIIEFAGKTENMTHII